MNRKAYNSDLTDAEWVILALFIPPVLPCGRPRKHDWREILDAIFYLTHGGGAHGDDGGQSPLYSWIESVASSW